MCAGTAAGDCSLKKKSNFLMFSKVLRKAHDQANYPSKKPQPNSTRLNDTLISDIIFSFFNCYYK